MLRHELFGFMPQGKVREDDITLSAKQKPSKRKIYTLAKLLVMHCVAWSQLPYQNLRR